MASSHPLEEVLSRDARAAHRRDANRRAIIDAATALEIALGRHVRSVADQLSATQRQRISERTALGDYIWIAEHSGLQLAVPVDRLRWLSRLRNDAAHRGAAPSRLGRRRRGAVDDRLPQCTRATSPDGRTRA